MRIVSLFSGAGGLDLGLVNAGHEIIWANDFDLDSCLTYSANIGNHIVHGDISSISSDTIPDCDVVTGGFPCQGFSIANKFRAGDDQRNQLYLELLRVIQDKLPKWFIAENVKGLLSLERGKVFEMILKDFENIGYRVKYKVVNMADHGVPQTRQRVIILGTRVDLPSSLDLTHPEPTHHKNENLILLPWVSISQALSTFRLPEDAQDLVSNYRVVVRDFVGHRPTDPNKPSPTILARGNGKGGNNALPHPTENRRLSVMESAYIQTFPTTFKFKGKMTSQYRQIGNAVPVLYGQHLGNQLSLLEELKGV